ncbi:MAG TPA: EamA family transporter [Bryobacteraceae bacterium]|nr:EamA family transporter [Bryobacteraceae bacterium]
MGSRTTPLRSYSALAALYFFWGTTYLGIRIALETFPPLQLIAIRFLLSGGMLLLGAKLLGLHIPTGKELRMTALYGLIMLGTGNGALVYAEQWIPSGLAALFVSTAPFWMVGLQTVLPPTERIHPPTLAGIIVGFLGVLILVAPAALGAPGSQGIIQGFLLLQFSVCCWCLGALLQRRLPTQANPIVSGAVQQFAVGLFYTPLALLVPAHPIRWSDRGILALVWLVLFGSIVGYSAFTYSMEYLPVAIVATHTFVNPIVAVFLGWLILAEPFGWREALAIVAVVLGVALVKIFSRKPSPKQSRAAEA